MGKLEVRIMKDEVGEEGLTRESGDAPDIMGKKKRFSRRDAKPPRGEEDGA